MFAAAPSSIVGPIQSDLGWHVVRVDDLRGEAGRSLAEARAEIVTKLGADKRKEALLDRVTKVEEAIESGSSIVDAARDAGLPDDYLREIAALAPHAGTRPGTAAAKPPVRPLWASPLAKD